jgi:nitrogen regulatory protein P-II 2
MRTPLKLVTIIAEALLKAELIEDILRLGARGYTVSGVEGEGTRGIHAAEWEGPNVKIETLVPDEVAERILDQVARTYFPHFAVVAYVTTVEVLRPEKYG